MPTNRTDRLNSLLKEVISDVIKRQVRNPNISEFITIMRVQITKDLHYAKVYVSVIGTKEIKESTILALQASAGFIARLASKQVVMRFFPSLTFILDESVDKHMRIEELLKEIKEEEEQRPSHGEDV